MSSWSVMTYKDTWLPHFYTIPVISPSSATSDSPKGHDLGDLWTSCRSLLEKLDPKVEKKDLEAIDEGIRQFCELDPGSTSFRYPVTTKGDKSLPPNLKYINVRNLSDVMEKISNFFEAIAMMVSVYLDYKSDMARDFGDN